MGEAVASPAFFIECCYPGRKNMIRAALLDMDGLLIDTEPLWEEAEVSVFRQFGIELSGEICQKIKGFRIDESVRYLLRVSSAKPDATPMEIEKAIVARVKQLIEIKGKGMPGFVYIIHFFKSRKVPIALASSSKKEIIQVALQKLGIIQHFDSIHSAEDEPYGKPHPGIFLTAAARLGAEPDDCLVFEDSLNGIIAAKAARMKAVLIPDKSLAGDRRVAIADIELKSLLSFKEDYLQQLFP